MIISGDFVKILEDDFCKIVDMEYSLFATEFSESNAKKNWFNNGVSWIQTSYLFSPKGFLHFKINDDRVDTYKTCYVRVYAIVGNTVSSEVYPFCVIPDIKNMNSNKDSFVQGEDNWLFIDLRNFDIRCAFLPSPVSTNLLKREILNKHIHTQGNSGESYYVRDVSDIFNAVASYKSIMSRGEKSVVRTRYQ